MLHVDGITHTASSIGRAGMMASKLPQHAAKVHHALNNFASRADTRLLHIGHSMPYVIWENEHVKAHWIDDDFENAPPRPDIYPYTLVIIDAPKLRPLILKHHVDKLSDEFVFAVNNWKSPEMRRGVDRELKRFDAWDVVSRMEFMADDDPSGWKDGLAVFVMVR